MFEDATLSKGALVLVIASSLALAGFVGYSVRNSNISYSTLTESITITSTIISYSQIIGLVFASHIQKLEVGNVSEVMKDYESNAVMIWEGNAQGSQGTYEGSANISLAFDFLHPDQNFSIWNSTYSDSINSNQSGFAVASVNSTIHIQGFNIVVGKFSGVVSAKINYVNKSSNNSWLISNETWNFLQFDISNPGFA